jgi:hypothetical protein
MFWSSRERAWRAQGIRCTRQEYLERHAAQRARCALCGEPERLLYALAVDHDHVTHVIRGLLHQQCNTSIEKVVREAPRVAEYLARTAA